jgi:hypothetical protein
MKKVSGYRIFVTEYVNRYIDTNNNDNTYNDHGDHDRHDDDDDDKYGEQQPKAYLYSHG